MKCRDPLRALTVCDDTWEKMHVHNRNTHFSCFTCHWEISPTTTFCHSFSSGMPWTDKSKPSTTKWLGKNGHFTCSSIPAGVQEIIMHSKGKRKRERETNLKVNICKYMHINYCWCVRSVWSSGHDHTLLHVRAQVWILTGPTVVSTFFLFLFSCSASLFTSIVQLLLSVLELQSNVIEI